MTQLTGQERATYVQNMFTYKYFTTPVNGLEKSSKKELLTQQNS